MYNFIRIYKQYSPLFFFAAAFYLSANMLFIPSAKAFEELSYAPAKKTSGPSLYLQLKTLLKQKYKHDVADYLIAHTDLNADNLMEHIIKLKNCGKYTNICTYTVIIERNAKLDIISRINTNQLIVGDDQNYGIKNLLAFRNPKNAYDFDIYMWSPSEKTYILDAGKTRN